MTGDDSALADALEEFFLGLACVGRLEDMKKIDELDLSFSQGRILMLVGTASEPLPIHSIAEQAHLSVAAAGRNVDHLVRTDALTRTESEVDRRVKLVAPTPRGREIIALYLDARRGAVERFVERLPEPERAALYAAIVGVLQSGALSVDPALAPTSTVIGARS